MKLTIEHIKAYPFGDNGLKVLRPDSKTILPVYGIIGNLIAHKENNMLTYSGLSGCRPILRNLTDLTKEIEVNGEKFVPIYKLLNAKEGDFIFKVIHSEIWLKNRIELYTNPEHCDHTGETIPSQFVESIYLSAITAQPYYRMVKLFEWHFDVFGLIEAKLAIDINTLKP